VIALFQFANVLGWRDAADDPIRPVGKRCLVDDGIKDIRLYAMSLTPILRKDVMYIDIFSEEDSVVEVLPRTEILGSVPSLRER
jgi:hypothetical protein